MLSEPVNLRKERDGPFSLEKREIFLRSYRQGDFLRNHQKVGSGIFMRR
jgi:hypothetical protein